MCKLAIIEYANGINMKRQTEPEWTAAQSTGFLRNLLLELRRERDKHGRKNQERIGRVEKILSDRGAA